MGTSVDCNLNSKTFAAHTCTGDRHSVTTSHLRFPLDRLASSQTSKGNNGCRRERDMIRNDRGSTRPPLHIPQIPRGARYRHKQLRDHRPHTADPPDQLHQLRQQRRFPEKWIYKTSQLARNQLAENQRDSAHPTQTFTQIPPATKVEAHRRSSPYLSETWEMIKL